MNTATKSSDILDQVSEFLKPELDALEAEIASVVESDTHLVKEVGHYVLSCKGKRLRPMMLLLVAKAAGYAGSDHVNVAAALEIIHTATLLHDDVIDKASLRRGQPTVNHRWGDDVAILIADYLYANAFRLATLSLSPVVVTTICKVTAQMCEGEMYQIEKRQQFLTTEDYLRIVRHKTSFLFSACTGLGAALAGMNEGQIAALTSFGLEFGTAFQIVDDTLDLVGQDDEIGKDSGTDIRNGKQTLPLIYAYEQADAAQRQKLDQLWKSNNNTGAWLEVIRTHNGVDHALTVAREYAGNAKTYLAELPDGPARQLCERLADYVADRTC